MAETKEAPAGTPTKKETAKNGGKLATPKKNKSNSQRSQTPVAPPKKRITNISDRLSKAIDGAKEQKNRSPDLVHLGKDFDDMRKQLRSLILKTRKYNDAYIQAEKARKEMISEIGKLSEGTPLFQDVGKHQNNESIVHINEAASKEAENNAKEFRAKIVEYAAEWEEIVTGLVDQEMNNARKLGKDKSHYDGKVEKLRQEINKLENSGRPTPDTKAERLKRNEDKLKEAFIAYEEAASKTCFLIEEVVKSGWKDLYPFVKSTMNWEINRVQGESELFADLPDAVDRMVIAYKANKKK